MRLYKNAISLLSRAKDYIFNSSWIVLEKIFISGISFIVTIIVARYLGAEQLGLISYSLSLVAIVAVSGHMGLGSLVVRELVRSPESKDLILGSSFFLKFAGYLSGFILLGLFAYFSEDSSDIRFWILIIFASSIIFRSFDVIDFLFQSDLNAKYGSISKIFSSIFGNLIKILVVFSGSTLIYFAFAHLFEALICASILIFFYKHKFKQSIFSWKVSKSRMYKLVSDGTLIFLGTILSVIYLKVDQVMLKWIVGLEEVGIYAVASTISETWKFIPAAIMISFFPKLIQLKKLNQSQYKARLQQLLDIIFISGLTIAILITFFAEELILLLFGDAFIGAANILTIHIWASLFIFMRAVFSRWILIEDMLVFSVITHGLGTITNVLLNLWLIPIYGGIGAAFATLISYSVASYISLLFHSKTRVIFFMMSKAMISPLRYLFYNQRT